jgi:hypothetical protein
MLLLFPVKATGQSYWFTFNNIPYVEVGGNFLALNEAFDDTVYTHIPIGFQFRFAGRAWTELHISSNGEIYFGDDPENFDTLKAIIPFGTDLYGDYINHTPAISYESGGCAGAVVMKIQFKECSLKGGSTEDFINFQVWLYESSGMVEYHFGPGQALSAPACFGGQSGPMCGIRFTVPETGAVLYSLLLTSFAFGPDTSLSELPVYLEGIPENGMVYILEPVITTGNGELTIKENQPYIFTNRQAGNFILHFTKNQPGKIRAEIMDITGRMIDRVNDDILFSGPQQLVFSLQGLPAGAYIVRLKDGDQYYGIKFIL